MFVFARCDWEHHLYSNDGYPGDVWRSGHGEPTDLDTWTRHVVSTHAQVWPSYAADRATQGRSSASFQGNTLEADRQLGRQNWVEQPRLQELRLLWRQCDATLHVLHVLHVRWPSYNITKLVTMLGKLRSISRSCSCIHLQIYGFHVPTHCRAHSLSQRYLVPLSPSCW